MAIRERKGRATPWEIYYNNPITGKRESKYVKTKAEALKEDSLIKHRLKFERESFRPADWQEEKEEPHELTLEEAYFLYLREKQFSKKGLETQLIGIRPLLKSYANVELSTFTRKELNGVIAAMEKLPIKQTTFHRRITVIKAFFNWCVRKEYFQGIAFPQIPQGHYEKFIPPTPEELRSMFHAAASHIQRVIILGSQCGIRVGSSELFKLTWDDVDFEMGIIRVQAAHKNPSAPWREIPMRQSLKKVMREWSDADLAEGITHIINYMGKPVASIKRAWTNMLQKAGITRRIRPYDLRHSFATELIAQGVDIGTIAKLMGHSSPNMIYQHYQYVLDKQKIAAVEALPDLAYMSKKMCPTEKGITLDG